LNCVANGRLLREGPLERLWIQPAAGDAGGAIGAALAHWHMHRGQPRSVQSSAAQRGSLLGPAISGLDARAALESMGAVIESHDEASMVEAVATELALGRIVGHIEGRAEFGPRALGY
jgi:carbamoyltransferase